MVNISEVKKEITQILNSLNGILDKRYLKEVDRYAKFNEFILAVEMLCEFLDEENIVLDADPKQKICDIAKKLNVDRSYWESL